MLRKHDQTHQNINVDIFKDISYKVLRHSSVKPGKSDHSHKYYVEKVKDAGEHKS